MARRQLRVKTWSYSRWADYDTCPLRFRLTRLEKRREPSSPAADRGTKIHQWADELVSAEEPLAHAPELESVFVEIQSMRTMNAVSEEMWILDREWQPVPTEEKDGRLTQDWERAWLLIKVDAHALRPDRVLLINDWKSGKVRETSLKQTELYAIAGFAIFDVDRVVTALHYTDAEEKIEAEYARSEADSLASTWERRVEKMFSDTRFVPNPGIHCKWCGHAKSKGGPCAFG